jgi:hypothetical protein
MSGMRSHLLAKKAAVPPLVQTADGAPTVSLMGSGLTRLLLRIFPEINSISGILYAKVVW